MAVLLEVFLFTACASGASKANEKIELGQKYLTELNYTEAVAAFTEVIKSTLPTLKRMRAVQKLTRA